MPKAEATEEKAEQPIIVKKIKKGGGHHGGAWKVAYADFVTAMMAFFLLLWLLNVTTDEQRNAISNYFDPTNIKASKNESGAGGVLGGLTMSPQGSMASTVQQIQPIQAAPGRPATTTSLKGEDKKEIGESKAGQEKRKAEQQRFEKAAQALKQAIEQAPELAELARHLIIDITPEGLRIQIIDQEGNPMFPLGSAQMYDKTRMLITKITEVVQPMPNDISIRGHTDSIPYSAGANYSNWELSSDRANASRRVMLAAGMAPERLNNVMGKAEREPLLPDDPKAAQNRRISIILLREELTSAGNSDQTTTEDGEDNAESESDLPMAAPTQPVGTFQRTPGKVQFP